MPTAWAYVSAKIDDDDVTASLAECKAKAITKLGSPDIELYEKSWTDKVLCTTWRLVTPDPPQNP